MTSNLPRSAELAAFHDTAIGKADHSPPYPDPIWEAIARNHRFNCLLWAEEDLARRRGVPDSEIAANKRAIDGYNQKRNDATETVDEILLTALSQVRRVEPCRLNSETAGSMIDRLSIIALKVFHMALQAQRLEAGPEHVERCVAKLASLREQRLDLQSCFDALLAECQAGRSCYKIYRQFKMYNDPALNPQLYAGGSAEPGTPRQR